MKLIGLIAFRDEEPFLPFLLASIQGVVDGVVALDDRSRDGGAALVEQWGGHVVSAPPGESFGARRQHLLDIGRARGGTHFLCLDADEALTAQFGGSARDRIGSLRPGQALAVPFHTLWKGDAEVRRGREYALPLTCAFADDGSTNYDIVELHEPRVPAAYADERVRLPAATGGIVHFQFTAWRRAQVKQAWYRCREMLTGADPLSVNAHYLTTMDTSLTRTRPSDPSWFALMPDRTALFDLAASWHRDALFQWLDEFGVEHFERLHIWQVPELRERFVEQTGRQPQPDPMAAVLARRGLSTSNELSRALAGKVRRRLGRGRLTPPKVSSSGR